MEMTAGVQDQTRFGGGTFTRLALSDRPTSAFRKALNQQGAVRAALEGDSPSPLIGEILLAAQIWWITAGNRSV